MFQGEVDLDTVAGTLRSGSTMDLDYEQYVQSGNLDLSDVVIGTDLSDIVDSICKDGGFPDSPPDSGSEHLMSPSSSSVTFSGRGYTNSGMTVEDYGTYGKSSLEVLPDLNKINYSVPLQMIESSDADYKVRALLNHDEHVH